MRSTTSPKLFADSRIHFGSVKWPVTLEVCIFAKLASHCTLRPLADWLVHHPLNVKLELTFLHEEHFWTVQKVRVRFPLPNARVMFLETAPCLMQGHAVALALHEEADEAEQPF